MPRLGRHTIFTFMVGFSPVFAESAPLKVILAKLRDKLRARVGAYLSLDGKVLAMVYALAARAPRMSLAR